MEGPDTLHFQDISAAESAEEEEDRSDEIKQLLTEAFSNETFDDDSETSYAAPDTSNHREDGNPRLSGSENGLNRLLLPASATKVLGNKLNGNGDSGHYFRNLNGNGGIYRNGSLGSFFSGIGVDSEDVNVLNGNLNGPKKVRFHSNSEENVNFVSNGNGRQADRGVEEIEVTNETVSMLHQKHCPQNGNNAGGDHDHDSIGEKFEQLTALLELREKRIKKLETEAEVYAKDKRSLNHQIGLMKTEMVQMKNAGDELQRVVELRDEEIRYLKTKMTEAIEEYEQVRQQEMNARDETNRYADEVGRLQHQVQLLSSVGTATQQAETNDVVRQIRERHAKDIAVWQATAADLESQLQIYKRGQQNALHESIIRDLEDAAVQTDNEVPISTELEMFDRSCQVVESSPRKVTMTDAQTDPVPSPEIPLVNCATQTDRVDTVERRVSAMNLQNIRRADFGQSVDLTAPTQTYEKVADDDKTDRGPMSMQEYEISVIEKWKVALAKADEEKHKLIDFYEKEVEEYKTKLAVMPSKLYDVWNKQQEELGLIFGHGRSPTGRRSSSLKRPILIDVATQATVQSPIASHSSTQTTSAPLKAPSKDAQTEPASNDFVAQLRPQEYPSSRSVTATFSEKETSSVVIQTEETLETFNMLGDLIQGWAKEVKQSQLRAERAEKQAYTIADKCVKMEKALKILKKDSKEKEIYLRQKSEEQRLQFLNVLSKVSSKLDVVE